ncbi:potassium transporter TrkA [Thiocapsa imhoffii]|uniref:Potassium transporter TrkA n=1 Tax=Thiocapsa imhoffii TaxID=382777 RepID=A0A9X0WH97_9GAMM|nr:potassium channel family protein [Thiocapsa imhoffii]MBK1644686.1 potassium transporter TrkA [Thiocapsa imhoffii]
MGNIVYLIMRRMRTPLLVLISTYAVAMAGMVLIPAQDAAGHPVPYNFFHAFYFVSYMSTTIGFGELPENFTDAQRIWVSLMIFASVAVWLYAIGTLIRLLQDVSLQRAIRERRFRRRVRRLRDPFYLVCGHGQTGDALVRTLTDRHEHAVVIDIDEARINQLKLDDHREYVPALCADARHPRALEVAGLQHPLCKGVVALTNVNESNLKIAIAAKLMHPDIRVICRADSHDVEANMASFGTDHIYDPFDTFAMDLAIAIEAPCLALLSNWLSGFEGEPLDVPIFPPRDGRWVLCGYGRFGKAIYRHLNEQGLSLTVIEARPDRTGMPKDGVIHGRGTEAVTLEQAGIHEAVGLVAGTDNDADNLSIIMTALELNPTLFVVARQNHKHNQILFERVGAQVVMIPSSIIADRIRVRLGVPLLSEFLTHARFEDETWACELVSRIAGLVEEQVPHVWEIQVDEYHAPALYRASQEGVELTIAHLMSDSHDRDSVLPAIVLMRRHGETRELLPDAQARLRMGDHLLLCGALAVRHSMDWTLQDPNVLDYVLTGNTRPGGWIWRWLAQRGRSEPNP